MNPKGFKGYFRELIKQAKKRGFVLKPFRHPTATKISRNMIFVNSILCKVVYASRPRRFQENGGVYARYTFGKTNIDRGEKVLLLWAEKDNKAVFYPIPRWFIEDCFGEAKKEHHIYLRTTPKISNRGHKQVFNWAQFEDNWSVFGEPISATSITAP